MTTVQRPQALLTMLDCSTQRPVVVAAQAPHRGSKQDNLLAVVVHSTDIQDRIAVPDALRWLFRYHYQDLRQRRLYQQLIAMGQGECSSMKVEVIKRTEHTCSNCCLSIGLSNAASSNSTGHGVLPMIMICATHRLKP